MVRKGTVDELLNARQRKGAQATKPTRRSTRETDKGKAAAESGARSKRKASEAAQARIRCTFTGQTLQFPGPGAPSTSGRRQPPPPSPSTRKQQVSRKRKKGSAVQLDSCMVDGDTYRVGDDVYIWQDGFESEDNESEACEVCGSTHLEQPMLECSKCLRGFHSTCLSPPLKSVPEGDWFCPSCDKGHAVPPPAQLRACWQKFIYSNDQLLMARITEIVRDRQGDGKTEVGVLYYIRPEDTCMGRQRHHGAREVFLGTKAFWEPADVLLRPVMVVASASQCAEADSNDVFLCEYQYDQTWQRFRRLLPQRGQAAADQEGGVDSDWEMSGEEGSSSDDDEDELGGGYGKGAHKRRDISYRPEADEGVWRGPGNVRDYKGSAANRRVTNYEDLAAAMPNVGASSIPEAARQLREGGGGRFAALKEALTLAAMPTCLPCRDAEKDAVTRFVQEAVSPVAGSPGAMYICGVPGTGKTATVMEVLKGVRAASTGCQVVVINGLQLPAPGQVYSRLLEKLEGVRAGPQRALQLLEGRFAGTGDRAGAKGGRVPKTLLVVDEIDVLMTQDQSVLYNLFEWPTRPGTRLAVIGISNTHDLDERVLPRIASRLAEAKLAFKPYNVDQLRDIVLHRLGASASKLEPFAIKWAAMKVAHETGDARRALEMLRRAVEVAEVEAMKTGGVQQGAGAKPGGLVAPASKRPGGAASQSSQYLVKKEHVQTAMREMLEAVHMQLLRSCSPYEKALLSALLLEARATSRQDCSLEAAGKRLGPLCDLCMLPRLTAAALLTVAARLGEKRLVMCEAAAKHLRGRVAVVVQRDEVAGLVRDDPALQRIHAML